MSDARGPESWAELQARLGRDWAQALDQLAHAREHGDFTGWKPSADR